MNKRLAPADFSFPREETLDEREQKIKELMTYLLADRPVWKTSKEMRLVWVDQLGDFTRSELMIAARLFLANTKESPTVAAIKARINPMPAYEHVAPTTHQITRGSLPPWYDNDLGLTELLAAKRAWEATHSG